MDFDKKTLKSYSNTKINKSQSLPLLSRGFTIVELLIVVVVIAILAAITIVSYNGITSQAEDSALKSALRTASNKVSLEQAKDGVYPNTLPSDVETSTNSYTLDYSGGENYCMYVTSSKNTDRVFYISSQEGEIKEGGCPPPEIANNTPIQDITQAQCDALPTYTGSNEDAVRTVVDARGTARAYRIAKLADDNCWMLDNLKLGSTTGSITLKPSDSNVANNFTLPQLTTSGSSYDNPQVIGPVPGDTGAGATNYGYLYNWPAATAGETQASMPAGSGSAPHSICPASWRLPTGGYGGEFHQLVSSTSYWQYTGPFKGAAAGYWSGSGGFVGLGLNGHLWSSSVHDSNTSSAHNAYFGASHVTQFFSSHRDRGLGVRCLLN